jgi:hypothetical protein
VEPFLTLVIALGGIATGIGAIWTAVVARRQLNEQRVFLREQTEIARRQVQVTEKSFADQNERARLNLEFDLLNRLEDRRQTPHFMGRRRAAAKYLLDNAFGEDGMVEVPSLNAATIEVVGLYEDLGEMLRLGVLSAEPVRGRFGLIARAYWSFCKPAIYKMRAEWESPGLYEDFEYLCDLTESMDREEGMASAFTQEQLRQLMENEIKYGTVGEESPTSTQ